MNTKIQIKWAMSSYQLVYGDSDCHILIVLSPLPLTILEFGNVASNKFNL